MMGWMCTATGTLPTSSLSTLVGSNCTPGVGWGAIPGALINELVKQLTQSGSIKWAAEARGANEIFAVDPGEMGKNLARVTFAEYEPRLAFVGHPTVGLKGKPSVAQS